MGYLGKAVFGAVIGVAAIAAAPFTGGGSVLAGASLAASLTGAGLAATGAGLAGAAVGAVAEGVKEIEKEDEIGRAKSASFKDGMNEGKASTVQEIKKYTDFYLATTALSYYIARCDGSISDEEQLEIDFDLDSIKKNVDIPGAIKTEMMTIAVNESISFEEVIKYLDKVSVETLKKLSDDIDEIIEANGEITDAERKAKEQFNNYIAQREK